MATAVSADASSKKVGHRATTLVAGAIAGIIFAVLFGASATILRQTMGDTSNDTGSWLSGDTGAVKLALALLPFAGLAFLWFIAVVRARLGRFEDQFFSTVFIGSGLLFLAMVFAAAAATGAIVAAAVDDPGFANSSTYAYARQMGTQILSIYAVRMAAIFQLSQAALWMRTRVMPRWVALVTVVVAFVLLFVFSQSWWVALVFPAWVLLVSAYILIARAASDQSEGANAQLR